MSRKKKLAQKKKTRIKRNTIIFSLLILGIVLSYTGYIIFQAFLAANEAYDDLGRKKSDLREDEVSISNHPVSLLLMGLETYSSGGSNGRTDALMVITFNPNDQRLKLLSIPRDTLVDISGHKKDKITHAHVFGGKKLTIETVEELLEIPVDYYASVDFDTFVNVINILGGIEVNVPLEFTQDALDGSIYEFHEGKMELNGAQALAFVRMRKQDPKGDIGRNERQQEVIKAIIKELTSIGTITKVDDLADEIGNNVETNIKISEGISALKHFTNFSIDNIDQVTLETYPDRYNGASVQIVDPNSLIEAQNTLKEHLELK